MAGRNIVLMPVADGVMGSQKIKREAERQRLKQLMLSIKPTGFGIIIRTVAEDKRAAELDSELRLLMERWTQTVKTLQQKEPVSLVSEEMGRTLGIIRDVLSPDFTSIQINDVEDMSRWLVGSSSISNSGEVIRSFPSATRVFCPPERVFIT